MNVLSLIAYNVQVYMCYYMISVLVINDSQLYKCMYMYVRVCVCVFVQYVNDDGMIGIGE